MSVTMPSPASPALGNWHTQGLCVGEDPKLFFPSHCDPATKARKTCAARPDRTECLNYATAVDE
jgi:hypothetical protein